MPVVWWLDTKLPHDSAILLLAVYSEGVKAGGLKILLTKVHSRIIHNSQEMETIQILSTNEQINKNSHAHEWRIIQA